MAKRTAPKGPRKTLEQMEAYHKKKLDNIATRRQIEDLRKKLKK